MTRAVVEKEEEALNGTSQVVKGQIKGKRHKLVVFTHNCLSVCYSGTG